MLLQNVMTFLAYSFYLYVPCCITFTVCSQTAGAHDLSAAQRATYCNSLCNYTIYVTVTGTQLIQMNPGFKR